MSNPARLVPVEPTREMTDAAEYLVRRHGEMIRGAGLWEAMLAVAPPPPESDLLRAAKEYVLCKDALETFEHDNPNDCGRTWDKLFSDRGLAETALRRAIKAAQSAEKDKP